MKISQQVVQEQFMTRIQFFFLNSELSLEVIQTFRRFIVSACCINVIKILPAIMTATVYHLEGDKNVVLPSILLSRDGF